MKSLILPVFLLVALSGSAQDYDSGDGNSGTALYRTRDFYAGVTIGSMYANKHTAFRYDGWDGEYTDFDWSVERLLFQSGPNNTQSLYNQVREVLGQRDFQMGEYPENVRYNLSVSIGGVLGYYVSEGTALFVEGMFSRLRTKDVFTLEVESGNPTITEPDYELCGIDGFEERLDVTAGVHVDFDPLEQGTLYMQLGAMLNATRARKNEITIRTLKYTLWQWNENSNAYQNVDFGGLGFGGKAGLGYRFKFNEQFTFDLGADVFLQKINLGPDPIQKWKMQYFAYLRLLWL